MFKLSDKSTKKSQYSVGHLPYQYKNPLIKLSFLSVICLSSFSLFACTPQAEDSNKSDDHTKKTDAKKGDGAKGKKNDSDKGSDKKPGAERTDDKNPKTVSNNSTLDTFLEKTKETIDSNLKLPKEIVKIAEDYEQSKGKKKKWRDNHIIVTVDPNGNILKMQFKTELPSIEIEDINNAIEKAINESKPFKNPPLGKKNSFTFMVRLLGTKPFVTEYDALVESKRSPKDESDSEESSEDSSSNNDDD